MRDGSLVFGDYAFTHLNYRWLFDKDYTIYI